jgi:hypothetical protein
MSSASRHAQLEGGRLVKDAHIWVGVDGVLESGQGVEGWARVGVVHDHECIRRRDIAEERGDAVVGGVVDLISLDPLRVGVVQMDKPAGSRQLFDNRGRRGRVHDVGLLDSLARSGDHDDPSGVSLGHGLEVAHRVRHNGGLAQHGHHYEECDSALVIRRRDGDWHPTCSEEPR